jgi:hypothetical protein
MTRAGVVSLFALILWGFLASCAWMSVGQVTPQLDDFSVQPYRGGNGRIYYAVREIDVGTEIFQSLQLGLLDNPTFKESVYMSEPPERGVFCLITLRRESRPPFMMAWAFLSGISLALIPFVDSSGERYAVTYDLYIDKDLKKAYQYEIVARGLIWLGAPLLKPFMPADWKESLVNQRALGKGFLSTARAFWHDAHEDGHF